MQSVLIKGSIRMHGIEHKSVPHARLVLYTRRAPSGILVQHICIIIQHRNTTKGKVELQPRAGILACWPVALCLLIGRATQPKKRNSAYLKSCSTGFVVKACHLQQINTISPFQWKDCLASLLNICQIEKNRSHLQDINMCQRMLCRMRGMQNTQQMFRT